MKREIETATILNVDDDEAKRYVVSRILSKAGFDVREAATGHQALAAAFQSRPDLVVLDVNLPDLHGFEVCRTLKTDPRTASIPVLHVSATAIDANDRIRGLEGGADAYLAENVPAAEFIATIRALLRIKQAEEAARTLAAQWQITFEAIDRGIVILDGESKIVRCNSAFARWAGRSSTDLEGGLAGEIPLLRNPPPSSDELQIGGKWYQRNTHGSPPDAGADAGQTVLVISDITEHKNTVEALRASESRLDLAQQAGRIGTFDWDLRSGRNIWNEALERLYGLEPGGFEGTNQDWAKRVHPEDLPIVESSFRKSLELGKAEDDFEFRIVRPDGSLRWMHARAQYSYDETGKPVRMLGINMDVTERKTLDERMREAHKLESVGRLAGGIAHDFNNLLVGVLGSATLLLDDLPHDYGLRWVVETIASAGERAASLTRQLLAYAGKSHFFIESIDISEVVSDTSALAQAAIPKDVGLHFNLARGLPKVEADRSQIQQIVMNLVLNAAEAFPDKKGRISISTRIFDARSESTSLQLASDETAPICVMIEVADNGPGMDDATRARIFDPFFTTKFMGRGLGLAAVQGIVRAHHGAIAAESSVGSGTRFTILLPAAKTRDTSPETIEHPAASPVKGTILLVDDEAVVRSTSKAILERRGHTVLTACDGREALEVFRENKDRISLVVLDLTMPVMNGDAALIELQKIEPNVPVLLSSGFDEAQILHQFEGRKVSGFIQKPYHLARLAQEVSRVLEAGSRSAAS